MDCGWLTLYTDRLLICIRCTLVTEDANEKGIQGGIWTTGDSKETGCPLQQSVKRKLNQDFRGSPVVGTSSTGGTGSITGWEAKRPTWLVDQKKCKIQNRRKITANSVKLEMQPPENTQFLNYCSLLVLGGKYAESIPGPCTRCWRFLGQSSVRSTNTWLTG